MDPRLDEIMSLLARLARGDMRARVDRPLSHDALDAIICGINMLGEELEHAQREWNRTLEQLVARTRELEQAQADALRNDRLATLGQLAAIVSHELRNPLGTIRTSAWWVQQQLGAVDAGTKRGFERIERSVQRCDSIIAELLDFVRSPKLTIVGEDLDAWLHGLLNEYALPPQVTLRRKLSSGAAVAVDPDRFRQCVINLLDNACSAVSKTPGAQVVVCTSQVDGEARLEVRDNGPGISEQNLDRVFEPLFSTKSFGVGLGLAVSQQIVHAHGGTIAVSSAPGEGAAFCVKLPLRAAADADARHASMRDPAG